MSFVDRSVHPQTAVDAEHDRRRSSIVALALLVMVALVTQPQPAEAYTANPESAHYPTVQYNHRGNDVKALQYLLKGWGVLARFN